MFTESPQIINDATVGQVVVAATATPTASATPTPTSPFPTVTATPQPFERRYKPIPMSIYGYGPKGAIVALKGFGVSEETTADDTGFFRFSSIYSLSKNYPELCLQARDAQNRTTQPSCIPALPVDRKTPLEVGPVLLSPTISLSDNNVVTEDFVFIDGLTSPETEVNIYVSKDNKRYLSLVKEVSAYSFPILKTKSDKQGRFSLVLPTTEESNYKIYASSLYGKDLSAKSNTLKFSVLGEFKSFWQKIIDFFGKNKILALIFLELVTAILLLLYALKLTKKPQKHTEKDYLLWLSKT